MRLLRSSKGNALVIMTAATIPLAGMIGGGVDISRMYIVKTRLQHACDAGALAGRKTMGGGTWAFNRNYAQSQANQFFDGNFENGSFSSTGLTRAFTENAGKVTGIASATVPMTLMRIFGNDARTLSVTCDAEMRLPNTDVMFVLDTTGSMGETPTGDTATKLESLKVAVKCFYEIVARLDTNASCTTGTPSGGTGSQVQIRFGFVPYATNVNVGKLLKPEWFRDTAPYQTRQAQFVDRVTTTGPIVTATIFVNRNPQNNWIPISTTILSKISCDQQAASGDPAFVPTYPEGPVTELNSSGSNPVTTTWATYQYGRYYEYRAVFDALKTCIIQRSLTFADMRRTYVRTDTTARAFDKWRYAQLPVNVGLLKNGSNWNPSFQWPIGYQGANQTIAWAGCVEERDTKSYAGYVPIPADAKDLDIDAVPIAGDPTTQWRPVLPGLIQTRSQDGMNWTISPFDSSDDKSLGSPYYACPREATKLQQWPTASAFSTYVDGLYAEGNTYHDIGLIWGARLLSPTGLFKSENAVTAQGGEIERHMIFMTDGDPCTGVDNYTAYGVNWFDRRTTDQNSVPTDGCTTTGTLTQQVNVRTDALCAAIRNKNITLWVITFGDLQPNTVTRMTNCATPGRYFSAKNAAQLQSTFKSIADQISMLRLTQ